MQNFFNFLIKLKGLTGLKSIVISYCENLRVIRRFAFRNLPNLKTLFISYNRNLKELEPNSFGSLYNLNYLSLGMNRLRVIEGYIFTVSSGIKIVDFIGNPIKHIKSHAFHGLRNVTDLIISNELSPSPVEIIEGDAFISTAFVENIYLKNIRAKYLSTYAFRGLAYCKNLFLDGTYLEEVEPDAFHRTNNIQNIYMNSSRIKRIKPDAFRGIYNVDKIDLRANYLTKLDHGTFESLVQQTKPEKNTLYANNSIVVIDENLRNQQRFNVKKLLFYQNPIQCDCSLVWVFDNWKQYQSIISLPEICAGPKGYDCLRTVEVTRDKLMCPLSSNETSKGLTSIRPPCEDLVFEVDENNGEDAMAAKNEYNQDENNEENPNEYFEDSGEYDSDPPPPPIRLISTKPGNLFISSSSTVRQSTKKALSMPTTTVPVHNNNKAAKNVNSKENNNLLNSRENFFSSSEKLKDTNSSRIEGSLVSANSGSSSSSLFSLVNFNLINKDIKLFKCFFIVVGSYYFYFLNFLLFYFQ
jgi:hypothetical protein